MSEIFYSQIDDHLKRELDARARAGKTDRSTKALDFMLGKIANVELTAWKLSGGTDIYAGDTESGEDLRLISSTPGQKQILDRIGGSTVRSGEYLPSGPLGYLNDQEVTIEDELTGGFDSDRIGLNRIPPYITSAEVSIGDHSMGLLNRASVNIVIPFPERDLEFFESVWMRPGRNVTIKIVHPDDAVITRDDGIYLTDETFPSYETIKELQPGLDQEEYRQSKKLNEYTFQGLVTSFTLDYQEDTSVQVSMQLTGTSNSYTDISFLQNTKKSQETTGTTDLIARGLNGETTPIVEDLPTNPEEVDVIQITDSPESLFDDFEATVDAYYNFNHGSDVTVFIGSSSGSFIGTILDGPNVQGRTDTWYAYGPPLSSDLLIQSQQVAGSNITLPRLIGSQHWYKYVTVGWIIQYFNNVIIDKNPESLQILCSSYNNLCTSNVYEHICSANPHRIMIVDRTNTVNQYDNGKVWRKSNYQNESEDLDAWFHKQQDDGTLVAYPSKIFVNMEVVKEIMDRILSDDGSFSVTGFFDALSAEIHKQLGGAVDMKFITHPKHDGVLLWYDANRIFASKNSKSVVPYDFPMFANDPRGSIVREFSFSTKLPENVKNLSYVLNQNPEEISESDIAPYMNFMYNSLEVKRERNFETGQLTITRNVGIQEKLEVINRIYREKHEKFVAELTDAKKQFIYDFDSDEKIYKLQQALRHYIQYPTPNIQNSNQLTAPILPFEVTVTIDGINGFRYGDVLDFKGLPERYRKNVVFSIISITHTVGTDGQWTTKLQCIMRPNITKTDA